MDNELQKALAQILNKTVSAAEAGVAFLQKELPEVIQQLLVWKAVESAIYFLTALVVLWFCLYAIRKMWAYSKTDSGRGSEALMFFPGVATGLSVLAMIQHIDWLKILIAPKLYLIEFAASLVK